jgi:hypothetical protein
VDHVKQLLHEGKFERERESIGCLCMLMVGWLSCSCGSSSTSLVEHIIALGLHALAGGGILDLCHIIGASVSAS